RKTRKKCARPWSRSAHYVYHLQAWFRYRYGTVLRRLAQPERTSATMEAEGVSRATWYRRRTVRQVPVRQVRPSASLATVTRHATGDGTAGAAGIQAQHAGRPNSTGRARRAVRGKKGVADKPSRGHHRTHLTAQDNNCHRVETAARAGDHG